MPVYGLRPDDVVTDTAGNVQTGATLTLHATQADAQAGSNPLATVTTSAGRWSADVSAVPVWVRTPNGAVYEIADFSAKADKTYVDTQITGLGNTYAAKAPRPAHVADYGAVGDGTTNDTAAIQSALAASPAVEFTSGKTYLTDALTVSKAGARIIGNGATLKLRTAAPAFITLDAAGIAVSGLTIDANNLASNWALSVTAGRTDVRVSGCAIKNASGTTTTALVKVYSGCDNFVLDGCHLSNVTTTNVGRGVLISDTTGTVVGVKIVNNLIENIQRTADGDGVVVQDFPGAVDVLIQGNTFRRCMKRSVKIMNAGVTVTGNTMDHTYNAGDGAAYAGVSAYASSTTITGNRMSGAVTIAWVDLIPIAGAFTDLVVANNTMTTDLSNRQSSADGISASPTSLTRATIIGNVIYGARHGVRLDNTLRDVTAVGNIIHELTGSAFVLKDTTGNPDGVTIALNTVRTVANYYIHTNGGNAPATLVEFGNQGVANFGYFGGNAASGLANGMTAPVTAAKTAGYTVAVTDDIVVMNAAAGTSVTLRDPGTVPRGRVYRVKNINAAALNVQSAGTSKTIDGAATMSLAQWQSARFVSDGTQWLTV